MVLLLLAMAVVTGNETEAQVVMMVAVIEVGTTGVAVMTAVETTAEAEMIEVMVVGPEGAMEDTTVAAEVVLIKVATTEDRAAAVGIEERLAVTTSSFRKTPFSSLECPHPLPKTTFALTLELLELSRLTRKL